MMTGQLATVGRRLREAVKMIDPDDVEKVECVYMRMQFNNNNNNKTLIHSDFCFLLTFLPLFIKDHGISPRSCL